MGHSAGGRSAFSVNPPSPIAAAIVIYAALRCVSETLSGGTS
jgi:hypothetical protein